MSEAGRLNADVTPVGLERPPQEEASPLVLRILLVASLLVLGLVQTNRASERLDLIAGQVAMALPAVALVIFGFLGARRLAELFDSVTAQQERPRGSGP